MESIMELTGMEQTPEASEAGQAAHPTDVLDLPANAGSVRLTVAGWSPEGLAGKSGWACSIACFLPAGYHELTVLSGCAARTSNRRMAVTAVVEGLRRLPPGCDVYLATCCEYTSDCARRLASPRRSDPFVGKVKQGAAYNADLWRQFIELVGRTQYFRLEWLEKRSKDRFYPQVQASARMRGSNR